jgi:hypothetical protein
MRRVADSHAKQIDHFEACWDYSDPWGSEARLRAHLSDVEVSGRPAAQAETLSQIARAQVFQQRFDEAHATMALAKPLKVTSMRVKARLRLEAGRLAHAEGAPGRGCAEFLAALDLAARAGDDALRVDAAHMLGIVSSVPEQIEWNIRAISMAAMSRDPRARRWLGTLYANLGCACFDAQQFDVALAWFRLAQLWASRYGTPAQVRNARARIARWRRACQLEVGSVGPKETPTCTGRNEGTMSGIVLAPLTWSQLEHIDDVRPIDESDAECLEEIRLVLAKYGNLSRFGIALLHSHFELAEDEMMLETTNVALREHWVRPVKKSYLEEVGLDTQATIMSFDESGYRQDCGCCRDKDGHTGRHCT